MNKKSSEEENKQPAAGAPAPKLRQYMPHAGAAVKTDPKRKLQGEKFDPSKSGGDAPKPLPTVRQYMPSAGAAVKTDPKRKLQGERLDPAKIAEAKPMPTVRQYMPLKVGELRKAKAAEAEKTKANAPDAIRPLVEEEKPKTPRPVAKKVKRQPAAPPPEAAAPAAPVQAPPVAETPPAPVADAPAPEPVAAKPQKQEIRMSIDLGIPEKEQKADFSLDLGPEEPFAIEPSLEVEISEGGFLSGIFGPKASASKYSSFFSKPLTKMGEADFLYEPLVALERLDIARQLTPQIQKQVATLSCKKFKKALLDNGCPLHITTSAIEHGAIVGNNIYGDQLLNLLVPDLDESERDAFLATLIESGNLIERVGNCSFLGAPASHFAVQGKQNSYIELAALDEFDHDIDVEFRKWLLIYLDVAAEVCDIAANAGEGLSSIGRLGDARNAVASLEALGTVDAEAQPEAEE